MNPDRIKLGQVHVRINKPRRDDRPLPAQVARRSTLQLENLGNGSRINIYANAPRNQAQAGNRTSSWKHELAGNDHGPSLAETWPAKP